MLPAIAATTAQVLAFLAGKGPLTRHRQNKYYGHLEEWAFQRSAVQGARRFVGLARLGRLRQRLLAC